MQIKHRHILVPGRRYQDSRHILQNPKVSKSIMGFNNQAQRSTPPYYLDVDNPFNFFLIIVSNKSKLNAVYYQERKLISPTLGELTRKSS